MTLARFTNYVEGWNKAHGAEEKPAFPTEAEFEEMKRLHGDT
jgi:hypothetical protein